MDWIQRGNYIRICSIFVDKLLYVQIHAIEKSLAQQETATQTATLKKELQELAAQCNKAFIVAGLKESAHPEVRKALELCSSHLTCRATNKEKALPPIAGLWKEQQSFSQTIEDKKELATSVLGEDLVATLTEDKHQLPDVSGACMEASYCGHLKCVGTSCPFELTVPALE